MFITDLFTKPSQRAYIAPTVYLRAGKFMTGYNYYASLEKAVRKYNFLNNLAGGVDEIPAGSIRFVENGAAQTIGINCDFYVLKGSDWVLTDYKWLKSQTKWPPVIFRFLTPATQGPYYALFTANYFGMSATTLEDVEPEKVVELDVFWREVQLMRFRYNELVGFLNALAKRRLNTVEQQIFNEGMLLLNSMNNQMAGVRGIEIAYSEKNSVGLPVLLLIAGIAILAGATAYTVSTIVAETEKTKRINNSYELQKWVSEKKIEVAQLAASGQISSEAASGINGTLSTAAAIANQVAENSAKSSGLFDGLSSAIKWGAVGLLSFLLLKNLGGGHAK